MLRVVRKDEDVAPALRAGQAALDRLERIIDDRVDLAMLVAPQLGGLQDDGAPEAVVLQVRCMAVYRAFSASAFPPTAAFGAGSEMAQVAPAAHAATRTRERERKFIYD